jgi:hypothetical protein
MEKELDTFNNAFNEATGLTDDDTPHHGLHLDTESRPGWVVAAVHDDDRVVCELEDTLLAEAAVPYPNARMGMDFDPPLWETLGRLCGEDYLRRKATR